MIDSDAVRTSNNFIPDGLFNSKSCPPSSDQTRKQDYKIRKREKNVEKAFLPKQVGFQYFSLVLSSDVAPHSSTPSLSVPSPSPSRISSSSLSNMVEVKTVRESQKEQADFAEEIGSNLDAIENKSAKKKRRRLPFVPKLSCLTSDFDAPSVKIKNEDASIDIVSTNASQQRPPSHLIITVNGLIGSAEDWRYAAKQFLKAYPEDVIVHCSEKNSATLTFDGVDVMGERLADEVLSVIEVHPFVRKISFVGHSLGGLISRYAIAKLYGRKPSRFSEGNGENGHGSSTKAADEEKYKGKIAGLEPINFITSATPHLGSRGHKQVPLFCGIPALEKFARQASGLLGRTGKHLFLADHDDGKPPLLLRMVNDLEDLPFISALQSFRRRVVYANVHYDKLVGWSTSSLRHPNELPKRQQLSRNDRYRHIVNVEAATTSASAQEFYPLESIINSWKTFDTKAMMEIMLRHLTKLSWERVDCKFNGTKQIFAAHSTIQVPSHQYHSSGLDVIQHMVDTFLL